MFFFNGVNSHFLLIHNKNNLKTKWSIYLDDNEPELRSKFHFVPWIEFNNLVDCATGGGLKVFFLISTFLSSSSFRHHEKPAHCVLPCWYLGCLHALPGRVVRKLEVYQVKVRLSRYLYLYILHWQLVTNMEATFSGIPPLHFFICKKFKSFWPRASAQDPKCLLSLDRC